MGTKRKPSVGQLKFYENRLKLYKNKLELAKRICKEVGLDASTNNIAAIMGEDYWAFLRARMDFRKRKRKDS